MNALCKKTFRECSPTPYWTGPILLYKSEPFQAPGETKTLQQAKISSPSKRLSKELANPQDQEALADTDSPNRRVVLALYHALRSQDVSTVHNILTPDLEWWFHGPPSHQFLMRLLTGARHSSSSRKVFTFEPQVITSFGPIVLVEGCNRSRSIYWVHAWTVSDGIITQVREYFNTSLTVTKIGGGTTERSASEISKAHCTPLWESSLSERAGKSLPGLVLAI